MGVIANAAGNQGADGSWNATQSPVTTVIANAAGNHGTGGNVNANQTPDTTVLATAAGNHGATGSNICPRPAAKAADFDEQQRIMQYYKCLLHLQFQRPKVSPFGDYKDIIAQ